MLQLPPKLTSHYSSSQASKDVCELAMSLAYVYRYEPTRVSEALEAGKLGHAIMEQLHNIIQYENSYDPERLKDELCSTHWTEQPYYSQVMPPIILWLDSDDAQQYYTENQIIGVEEERQLNINGTNLIQKADLYVENVSGGREVLELKFWGRYNRISSLTVDPQMTNYHLTFNPDNKPDFKVTVLGFRKAKGTITPDYRMFHTERTSQHLKYGLARLTLQTQKFENLKQQIKANGLQNIIAYPGLHCDFCAYKDLCEKHQQGETDHFDMILETEFRKDNRYHHD